MIFIIFIVLGSIGIGSTLYLSSGKILAAEYGDHASNPWYAFHPENFESGLILYIRKWLRALLKTILFWLIIQYRTLTERITIKDQVKKRVRKFLYDHDQNSVHHPSDFWNRVRNSKKKPLEPSDEI